MRSIFHSAGGRCLRKFSSASHPGCASDWWAPTAAAKARCCACCLANFIRLAEKFAKRMHSASFISIRIADLILTFCFAEPLRRAPTPLFLLTGAALTRPVAHLSGGDRARVLIAQLMLQPADVLLLDEPTNDLDIPTLEILEESLLEYRGALVLVTHDRHMLDRVSTIVLGFDGLGGIETFADYSQWDAWQRTQMTI